MGGPRIISVTMRDANDVLGRRVVIEILNGPETESWEVELSPYEAEKFLSKLEELVGCYDLRLC